MASTPLMPIFKLIPSRGLPYVPIRPLHQPSQTRATHPARPRDAAQLNRATNQISS